MKYIFLKYLYLYRLEFCKKLEEQIKIKDYEKSIVCGN